VKARAITGALLVCAALAIVQGLAGAQPILSQPAGGSTQSSVPDRVWIAFPEAQARSARLEVRDPCGRRVDTGRPKVSGPRVTVTVDATASGRYDVTYAGVSAVDGNPTRGTFSFRVQGVEGCADADVPRNGGRAGRGIWDLPKADFVVALAIAALIGALGGFVYAAILGPKA
jgi:methionine-rich copper-binding protein CopC